MVEGQEEISRQAAVTLPSLGLCESDADRVHVCVGAQEARKGCVSASSCIDVESQSTKFKPSA